MIEFPSPFFCGPMAEVSTPALRMAVRSFGSKAILYSEMISAASVARGGSYNAIFCRTTPDDAPLVFQLLGNDPVVMAEAARLLDEKSPWGIDLNFGCSAPDIVKRDCGSRLLAEPARIGDIVRACRPHVAGALGIKIRGGMTKLDAELTNEVLRHAADAGADYAVLHARHAAQGFTRVSDWKFIASIAAKSPIPVVGNGDLVSAEGAVRRLYESGCAGVMISRRACSEPWMFRLAEILLNKENVTLEVNRRHTAESVLHDLETNLPMELHKSRGHRFCYYYTRPLMFGHELFSKIRQQSGIAGMRDLLFAYLDTHPEENELCYTCADGQVLSNR